MKFDEFFFFFFLNPPFFISMATAAKFVQPIAIFLAYLIQLDVDVTGNITAKLCEVGSEFNIFCTLITVMFVSISFLYALDDSDSVGCHGYLNQVLFRFLGSQADDLGVCHY